MSVPALKSHIVLIENDLLSRSFLARLLEQALCIPGIAPILMALRRRRMAYNAFSNNNNPINPATYNTMMQVLNDLSNTEVQTANPNIKGTPLYGYGAPALSYDGSEYPYNPEWDEYAVPENQDTLKWHLIENGLGNNLANLESWATPEQKNQLAREFTLLRNANDYARQEQLDQIAADQRQRNLYGDTLVDLLQNTPEGQSILEPIQLTRSAPTDRLSRQRNITGQGTGAFIK